MRKKVVSEENLKDAIASTTRALSKDPEIEITFSGTPTDSNIVLPNLPKKKSEIHSGREMYRKNLNHFYLLGENVFEFIFLPRSRHRG